MVLADLTWKMVLITVVGVFLGSFMDAIAGGGGIITVPTFLLAGLPTHFALGTNKLSAGIGTIASTARYVKTGYVDWRLGIPAVVLALIGSHFGTRLQLMLLSLKLFQKSARLQIKASSTRIQHPERSHVLLLLLIRWLNDFIIKELLYRHGAVLLLCPNGEYTFIEIPLSLRQSRAKYLRSCRSTPEPVPRPLRYRPLPAALPHWHREWHFCFLQL